jgi:ABC-type sugar transport system substrate-binding protein
VVKQIQQLFTCVQRLTEFRPRGIVVLPARDGTLDDVAREAARAGIAWTLLNRRAAALGKLPDEFRGHPIFAVTPDDRQIGDTQGRQLQALLPNGGRVLYVRGLVASATAFDREQSLRNVLSGTGIDLEAIDGGWTLDGARKGVELWLRTERSNRGADVIACQNDEMASGALRALESVATELGRPELLRLRVTGCDGLLNEGRRLVDERKLAATVIVPSTAGVAVDLLARSLQDGSKPPVETLVPCSSYPSLDQLARH